MVEIELLGNTVLAPRVVEAVLLPFMGEQRTLADVEGARSALEKAYQDAGFLTVFVDLPEQRVTDGLVRLSVTEGRIERVRVTGARYFSQGFIRDTTAVLQEGAVPNLNTLQTQLAELNRTPDRQVQPVFRPGREPGTVEVELKVKDSLPLSASIELHNRHSANTTPLRLVGTLRYDNLLQRDQALSLTFITAPEQPKASQVLVANWISPLPDRASLVASLVLSNSQVEPLGATVLGSGITAGLRWARPVVTPRSVHTLSLGLEYRDLKQRVQNGNGEVSTPLRYLPLQASHTVLWTGEDGTRTDTSTSLSNSLALGLRGLMARRIPCPGTTPDGLQDQFGCNRDGADGGFVTLRGDLRHSRAFAGGTLALRGAWQLAMQPLVSGEQFTLGGADSVRGYLESETAGDQAWLGAVEWRTPNLAGWLGGLLGAAGEGLYRSGVRGSGPLSELTVLVFAEAAQARVIDPLPGSAARVSLAGAGLGLRLRRGPQLSADLDLAWPLKPTANSPRSQARLHARLGAQF